jgi:TRAP-type C4-dicarboxylate transport system permease small subunit
MTRVFDLVEKAVEYIVTVLIFGILVTTLMQVISRYVFNAPFMWTEELARNLGIWLVLLCTGLVVREERHLSFDILPEAWKPVLRLIANLAIIFFSVSLIKGSIAFVRVSLGMKSSALQIPLWILYLAIPTGLILMAVFALDNTKKRIISFWHAKKGGQL